MRPNDDMVKIKMGACACFMGHFSRVPSQAEELKAPVKITMMIGLI